MPKRQSPQTIERTASDRRVRRRPSSDVATDARAGQLPTGPALTPGDVLALQRTMGNRAVSRLLARRGANEARDGRSAVRRARVIQREAKDGLVQRLDLREKPVEAEHPRLRRIRKLMGGRKGVVYLLENRRAEKLVVKFQRDSPAEAIVGTWFQRRAGATTPRIREADQADRLTLKRGVWKLLVASARMRSTGLLHQYLNDDGAYQHALLMDFAEGKPIKDMVANEPRRLAKALQDSVFLRSLGRILAADALSGNADRMMAVGKGDDLRGWYNEENLFIKKRYGTYTAVAIDNAFTPALTVGTAPFGVNQHMRVGSLAAAHRASFKIEAGLIFDRLVQEIRNTHGNRAVAGLVEGRAYFVTNVAFAAEAVMKQTLDRRFRGWKERLAAAGASPDDINDFGERKRYMRLIRLGCDPTKAHVVARDEKAYQKYILVHDLGYSRLRAHLVLKRGGKRAYQRAKLKKWA